MKSEILKIAGVKSEKEFYSKYPSEEAFMKAHGKEFKKAAMGKAMVKKQLTQLTDFSNPPQYVSGGPILPGTLSTAIENYQVDNFDPQLQTSAQLKPISQLPGISQAGLDASSQMQLANKTVAANQNPLDKFAGTRYAGLVGKVYKGVGALKAEKEKLKQAEKWNKVSGLVAQASALVPEEQKRNYVRPEDTIINPEQLFPSYGTGYNPGFAAKKGAVVKAQGGKNCRGKSWRPTISGEAGGGRASDVPADNSPVNYKQLVQSGYEMSDKKTMKQRAKDLQDQFPGISADDISAAMGDSARVKAKLWNYNQINKNIGEYNKMKGTSINEAHRIFPYSDYFYKFYEPSITKDASGKPIPLTATDILSTHSSPESYKKTVESNYRVPQNKNGGNLTEIQNTYAPNTLYDNLGFELLNDSNKLKDYKKGGRVKKAQGGADWTKILTKIGGLEGMDKMGAQLGGSAGSFIGGGGFEENAGSQFGSDLGGGVGEVLGKATGIPGMDKLLKTLGGFQYGLIGGFLDKKPKKTKELNKQTMRNIESANIQSGMRGLQGSYSPYVKDGGSIPQHEEGGWVSHDWQPQVITKFGDYDVKDLLKADPTMDTLRTGGRITQNNMFPTDQYAMGGSLKTTWGGHAEPISENPYDESETVMFRGKSHAEGDGNGHTGIGVKYGNEQHDSYTDYAEYGTEQADADVEVERGEPATEMLDPQTGEKNMVVFGNLIIPNGFMPGVKNKKFKNYVAELSKIENKENKKLDKSAKEIDELEVITPFDKLKLDSLNATMMGSNLKLKDISDKKRKLSSLQSAINDTAEEHGLDADSLAKGKIKIDKEAMKEQAKYGKELFKAQDGDKKFKVKGVQPGSIDYNPIGQTPEDMWNTPSSYEKVWKPKVKDAFDDPKRTEELISRIENYSGQDADDVKAAIAKGTTLEEKKNIAVRLATDKKVGPYHNLVNTLIDTPPLAKRPQKGRIASMTVTPGEIGTIPVEPVQSLKRNKLIDVLNQALPYLRPTDQEPLDPRQLTGEMYALSQNQLEPVQAQTYQPQLLTPYDISLQDQLNEVTAQQRAAERMTGQNPAAAAALMAQTDQARSKILGEQTRINQAQRMGVYNQNIATINDARLKNLGILDQQYQRQAQAKSATKAVTQAALNSISDKYAKHDAMNRELGIYENLYNYRYDKSGRAINMNPLQQFDVAAGSEKGGGTKGTLAPGYGYTYDENGQIIGTRKLKKDESESTGKNGAKIKSRNGSIVKAIKNL